MKSYQSLCALYYHLDKPVTSPEELAFYVQYAKSVSGSVLEPMCGTGRFLLPMLELGINIEGFDASRAMLEILNKKLRSKKQTATIWHQTLENLKPGNKTYSLIFIPSGSFGLITPLTLVEKCLTNIFDLLEPKGVFVFEIETSYSYDKSKKGIWFGAIQKDQAKTILANSLITSFKDNVVSTLVRYDLIENNRITTTEVEEYNTRLYTLAAMKRLLHVAGFKDIRTIRPYDIHLAPFEQSSSIIFECNK